MKKLTIITSVALALLLAPAAASASSAPWVTDSKAERFVSQKLPAWGGVNLHPEPNAPDEYGVARITPSLVVGCMGVYPSRRNRLGEDTFRRFECYIIAYQDTDGDGRTTYDDTERTFHIRVATRPSGRWAIAADRG